MVASSVSAEFDTAADAVVAGDVGELAVLLRDNPELVRARSTQAHRATLLHYIGANGVEDFRQKNPGNAIEITKLLLGAGAEVDAVAEMYGGATTLGLVATSVHPKRAGVQLALIEILLDHGAAVDGLPGRDSILNSALRNGHCDAAELLANRGAQIDLEGAAGLGRLDLVRSFVTENHGLKADAMKARMELGFMWACEYGRAEVVGFLLQHGMDIHAKQATGLTGLHWAVIGGHLQTIRLLLERGSDLEARNRYGGTALGQALWSAMNSDSGVDYVPVIEMLLRARAKIEEGSLAWLAEQPGRSELEKARIADVLRRYGATD